MEAVKNFVRPSRVREHAEERAKIARLEKAERDLLILQDRGTKAVQFLVKRHKSNHWRESIEMMIRGSI